MASWFRELGELAWVGARAATQSDRVRAAQYDELIRIVG
jgi:hypothetical protein